ncbi:hypothetical protein C1H46_008993 [Malus baccata]|uniref:IPT/TIG domain-containing protein n=1 Tax=Malus baccata TaxID=106549 RepID=A0A540N4E5_MALBA|nr:hypothetical protein C1H46_008993 [Malus baccata]
MQKMAQEWFSQTGSGVDDSQKPSSSSLLADWNSYAASQSTDESSSLGLGFDLESAVRSANDTVSGTFSVAAELYELQDLWRVLAEVLKKWDVVIIGSFLCDPSESAWTCMFGDVEVPAQIIQEGVIRCEAPPHLPRKVTVCITAGNRVSCSEVREFEYRRLPFTVGFLGTMMGTIYVSMVLHSYILSVFFSVLQVLALAYYAVSYFPGGSAGMKFLSSALASSVMRCFGR